MRKSGTQARWWGQMCFWTTRKKNDLAESAGELASFASVDTDTGSHQQWRPILEGELDKAREIQSEATGLHHREIEQAVISVFLSSQPIGHKALTPELLVLLGAANPGQDRIGKSPASLDRRVLVFRRSGDRHRRNRLGRPIAEGMAAGQSPQPAPDASRCL